MDIRLVEESDIATCNEFHNAAYARRRNESQWRWEFVPALLECDRIPYAVAEDGGRIVGTQALIPIKMIDGEGVYLTAKSEETLVDSQYRGQRLFEKMYDLLFDFARQYQLRHIWGFTPATKAFVRLGFEIPGQTRQLFFPFSAEAINRLDRSGLLAEGRAMNIHMTAGARRALVGTAGSISAARCRLATRTVTRQATHQGIVVKTLAEAPLASGELCRRFVAQWGGTTVYRDSTYLKWRIFSNPYVRATMRAAFLGDELLGWVAFSVGDDGFGYIVDVFVATGPSGTTDTDSVIRLLLCDAVAALRQAGVLGVRGWRVSDHPFDRLVTQAARQVGFYHVRRGFSVVVRSFPPGGTAPDDGWFDKWYISRIYTEGLAG